MLNRVLPSVRASVRLDLAVFPVVEGGKKPAIAGAFKFASKDPNLIYRYFASHPSLNYDPRRRPG
jgi:hypothetical protein